MGDRALGKGGGFSLFAMVVLVRNDPWRTVVVQKLHDIVDWPD